MIGCDLEGSHPRCQAITGGKVSGISCRKRAPGEIFQWRGLLFLIDAGMSLGVNGDTSGGGALHITGGSNPSVQALCANGRGKTLWDRQKNSGLEAIHCDK